MSCVADLLPQIGQHCFCIQTIKRLGQPVSITIELMKFCSKRKFACSIKSLLRNLLCKFSKKKFKDKPIFRDISLMIWFALQADVLSQISHRNIVQFYGIVSTQHNHCIVMGMYICYLLLVSLTKSRSLFRHFICDERSQHGIPSACEF